MFPRAVELTVILSDSNYVSESKSVVFESISPFPDLVQKRLIQGYYLLGSSKSTLRTGVLTSKQQDSKISIVNKKRKH